jgi:phage baseplate assembly protein W
MPNIFTDLDLSFSPHPDTGDIIPLLDERAIARSVRNIVMTNAYEKWEDPSFGGHVLQQMFENINPQTESIIKTKIRQSINQYEKRVELLDVELVQSTINNRINNNSLGVVVKFRIIGRQDATQVSFLLKRLR